MHARLSVAAPLALLLATTAHAAHQSTTVISEARGTAQTSNGVTISAGADVWFRNGALVGTPTAFGVGGASAAWDAGPFAPGATTVRATTIASAGASGRVDTDARASLDRGELKVVVDSAALAPFGSSGNAQGYFLDAIWFTNTSGGARPVTLTMTVDGTITGSGTRAEGFSYIGLSAGGGATCNSMGQCITPNPDGTGTTFFTIYGQFDMLAAPGDNFYFRNQAGGQINDAIPWWIFSLGAGHDPGSGLFDYTKSLTLWVPTGETTLFLEGWFRIAVCAGNRRCDFGNTTAIRFGAMPAGLAWTSQSGRFLAGLGTPPDPVPQPASWAMLVAGLALVGSLAVRRRRSDPAQRAVAWDRQPRSRAGAPDGGGGHG